ncbi:hypothetical protein ACJ73_07358, partial [Blastomyces percursus]
KSTGIICNAYWPVEGRASSSVCENVIETIDTKRTNLSLSRLWVETNPVGNDALGYWGKRAQLPSHHVGREEDEPSKPSQAKPSNRCFYQ